MVLLPPPAAATTDRTRVCAGIGCSRRACASTGQFNWAEAAALVCIAGLQRWFLVASMRAAAFPPATTFGQCAADLLGRRTWRSGFRLARSAAGADRSGPVGADACRCSYSFVRQDPPAIPFGGAGNVQIWSSARSVSSRPIAKTGAATHGFICQTVAPKIISGQRTLRKPTQHSAELEMAEQFFLYFISVCPMPTRPYGLKYRLSG